MPTKTPTSKAHEYIYYMTKHLRRDLHDRIRVQAAYRHTTIEDMMNLALGAGILAVERETAELRKARKVVQG